MHLLLIVFLIHGLSSLVLKLHFADVSASSNLEESSDNNEEHVDSAEKQDVATDAEPVPTIQVKNSNQADTEDGAKSEECSEEEAHTEVVERPDGKEVVSTVETELVVPTIQEENNQFGTEDEAESEQEEHSSVETYVQKAHEVVSTVEEVKPVLIVLEEKSNHSETDDAKTELKDTNNVEVEKVVCVVEIDAEFADVQASETDDDMFNDEDQHSEEITTLDANKTVLNISSKLA